MFVYTDGACSNNGRPNAKAGYGIYFGGNNPLNVSKCLLGKQTNNRAELTAIIEVYPLIESDMANGKTVCIMSDSIYAIRCAGEYGEKCFKNNWGAGKKKQIPNVALVKKAFELYQQPCQDGSVVFKHVLAHSGKQDIHSIGNEWADKLATSAIKTIRSK